MSYTSREVYEYISQQTSDPIVEWKTCAVSGQEFAIYASDLDFYNKISPTFEASQAIGDKLIATHPDYYSRTDGGKLRVQIPTPTLCPEERQRRRLAFRNERKLYRRRCDATGEQIVSIHSPDKPYKVYHQRYRRSDQRDALDYGRSYDMEQSFGKQFQELLFSVPAMNIMNDDGVGSENSEYRNNFSYGKNCYMIHTSRHGEDSMHCSSCQHIVRTYDSDGMGYTTDCYECLDSNNLTNCHYLTGCDECSDCQHGQSLIGCHHCFACVNLTNQSYHILNQPYSPDDYDSIMSDPHQRKQILSQYATLIQTSPHQALPISHSDGCYGGGIFDSSGIIMGYNIYRGKDCKYYFGGSDSPRNSYDITVGGDHDYGYESIVPDHSYHSLFTIYCRKCSHVMYCVDCHGSSHLFGCVGLRDKQYCIFNRQYTKEDYEQEVAKIINHMQTTGERGEFFDPSLSPFGYNETVAMEYFPLTQKDALAKNYVRCDYSSDPIIPAGVTTLTGDQVPSDITTVTDDILKHVIICEVSGRPFLIKEMELAFYRKHHLPLPRKHHDIRHTDRMHRRTPRHLSLRTCDYPTHEGPKEILSVYPTTSTHTVYCNTCYRREILG